MKTKLLKRLRSIGRDQVTVYSITKTNGCITGMEYGHPGEGYRNLFSGGMTEKEIKEKACKIWLSLNMEAIRKKYRKYTRKYSN
jgi:hypothetical protein